MVKLLIVGPNGAMGRALVRRAAADPDINLVAGVGPKGRDYIGIEMHSRTKRDAPSGTAKEMEEVIADELGHKLNDVAEYGRKGLGRRAPDSIQFSAIRSGGVPSTHQVIFGFEHESLELTHRAYDMEAFADGLIHAARFVSDRRRGYFTLQDVC